MLEIGQKVYLAGVGNNARRTDNLKEAIITKIGRKYFYVYVSNREYAYDINTYQQHYLPSDDSNGGYKLYFDKEAYETEKEKYALIDEIRKYFDKSATTIYKELDINTLRSIKSDIS
jgi:hypothetical protein